VASKFKKNDYIMDKGTKELYFIVKINDQNILVRNESDDSLKEIAHHFSNFAMIKVNPDIVKMLYERKCSSEEN